nr:MAG TPA: hypothetical protein [Caudoviricetes sp.]
MRTNDPANLRRQYPGHKVQVSAAYPRQAARPE